MKVLVVRFSSIGDIVLTTPVVRCLKQQLKAEVHYITKARFSALLEANPFIDKVFAFEKEITECAEALRAEQYDHIVDLHNNLRSFRLRWTLRRPGSRFDKLNFQKWMLVRFGINRLPEKHVVDRYMDTIAPLGAGYDGHGLDYFIPATEEIDPKGLGLPQQYLVFAIGANHNTKRLPLDKMIDLCKRVGSKLVLLGGPAERDEGEKIHEQVPEKTVNACGQLSLHGSASLIRQSEAVITHDTGMMHIAAAFHKPIFSIWGNTVPAFGMYPFYPEGMGEGTVLEVKNLKCRPCSKIGFDKCPRGHFKCMLDQDLSVLDGL